MKEIIEEDALNVNDLLKEINTDYTTMCNIYFDTMSELKFHTIKEICVACMCVSFYIAKKYDFALLESLFLNMISLACAKQFEKDGKDFFTKRLEVQH